MASPASSLALIVLLTGATGAQELLPPLEELPAEKPQPFRSFPKVIELPGVFDPIMNIGRLEMSPNRRPSLKLMGGDTAILGSDVVKDESQRPGFKLAKDFRDLDSSSYLISKLPQKVVIARLKWIRPQLTFQWLPEAADFVEAKQLCNCVLVVGADEIHSQALFLRKPQRLSPAPIRLADRATTAKFPLERLPALSTVRVEVLDVEGKFPAYYTNQADLRMPRGICVLNFGDGAVCKVKFGANINPFTGEMMVATSPRIDLQGFDKPVPWSAARLARLMEHNTKESKAASEKAAALRKQLSSARGSARSAIAKQQREVTRRRRTLTSQRKLLITVSNWTKQSGGKATVAFRVYHEVDGFEVDLAVVK